MSDKFIDINNKRFYKEFNKEVEKYISNGASKPQAISIVSKKYNLNPYKIMNNYYPNLKSINDDEYKDIKTEEGSFVTLKNDSEQKHYEVININNKDAIVLRNTDTNEEIVASETELTPVITENKMNRINEAQYNVSINGLETDNADALSQIFSLASQAETTDSLNDMDSNQMPMDMEDDYGFGDEMPMNSDENLMPMDVDTGMPMDMEDDVEFDQELPMDTDIDNMPMDMEDTMSMDTDIDSMSMEDMMNNGMYESADDGFSDEATEKINESIDDATMDYIADLVEEGYTSGFDPTWSLEITPNTNGFDDDEYSEDEELKEIARLIREGYTSGFDPTWSLYIDFDDDINESLRIAGINLDEAQEIIPGDELEDTDEDEGDEKGEQEEYAEEITESDDFDDEISETLRIAGVKLQEESNKSCNVKKSKNNEELEESTDENEKATDKYFKVNTDGLDGDVKKCKDSQCTITCESTVNKDKIKSIYETAKSMYAKKDVSEWNSLDRRYIEKLIKEGCSYKTSTKMLMEAKKGK